MGRCHSHLIASCLNTVSLLLELLFAKLGYFSILCLSQDEVSYVIDFYVLIYFIFYLNVFFLC